MSINKAIIVGRLGQDPELRKTNTGTAVANFSVATSETYKDEEITEWHRVVCFDRLAEICGEYLAKGRQVYVEGKLKTRTYTDRDGNERKSTEIKAYTVDFLGSRSDAQSLEELVPTVYPKKIKTTQRERTRGLETAAEFTDEDIPF